MDKTLIAIILCILLLAGIPLVCQLTKEPEPLTVDKIKDAYRAQNFSVANERTISRPGYQSDAEIFMTINGAKVHLFTYSNLEVIEQERIKMEVRRSKLIARLPTEKYRDNGAQQILRAFSSFARTRRFVIVSRRCFSRS